MYVRGNYSYACIMLVFTCTCVGVIGVMHCHFMQHFFHFPGPLNLGISIKCRHSLQLSAVYPYVCTVVGTALL